MALPTRFTPTEQLLSLQEDEEQRKRTGALLGLGGEAARLYRSSLAGQRAPTYGKGGFQPSTFTGYTAAQQRSGVPVNVDLVREVEAGRLNPYAIPAVDRPATGDDPDIDPAADSVATSRFGSLEVDRFNDPVTTGSVIGLFSPVPGLGTAIGGAVGRSRANERLDELVDPSISDAKVSFTDIGRAALDSATFGKAGRDIGTSFGIALDARTAELDPLSTSRELGPEFASMVDAAYTRAPDLAQYTDDFMSDLTGLQSSEVTGIDTSQAGGIEAVGRAAMSAEAAKQAFETIDVAGDPNTTDPSQQTQTQADRATMEDIDTGGTGSVGGGGPSAADVGNTTAETANQTTFDPDLPDDGADASDDAGDCFLTTEVVHRRGEADDGPTLTKMRKFRDVFMKDLPDEVAIYYDIAPKIIKAIPEEDETWNWLSEKIDESVDAIDQGDNNRAYKIYKSTVLKLKNDWLKDKELKDG